MKSCDCEWWQCLAETGELPQAQKCIHGKPNYCPSMEQDIRPLHYFEQMVEDALGG